MQRGDTFWYVPDPTVGSEQAGRRPCVVASRDAVNRSSPVVIVVPVTTYRGQALYPSDALIEAPDGGLPRDSVAMALHIRGVGRQRIGEPIGHLADDTMRRLEAAILSVLDIEP